MYVCTMWFVNEKDGDVEVWRERNAERKKKKKKKQKQKQRRRATGREARRRYVVEEGGD